MLSSDCVRRPFASFTASFFLPAACCQLLSAKSESSDSLRLFVSAKVFPIDSHSCAIFFLVIFCAPADAKLKPLSVSGSVQSESIDCAPSATSSLLPLRNFAAQNIFVEKSCGAHI